MRQYRETKSVGRGRGDAKGSVGFALLRSLATGFLCVATFNSGASLVAADPPRVAAPQNRSERTIDPTDIQLMSYNIRYANPNDGEDVWERRASTVIDVVGQPDIVGLQEVTASQWDTIRQATPEQAWYGVGRDDGDRAGEFSPIGYRRDRFNALDQGTFWLSETPDKVGSKSWDAALPRIASWVVLRDTVSNESLLVLNTHFDHRGEQARIEAGKLIRKKISEIAEDHKVIVMGDLNASPQSEPLQALQTSGGIALRDSRVISEEKPVGPAGTWNGFEKIQNDRRIDHVLVGSAVSVKRYKTLDSKTPEGRFASDHLPVAVVIRVFTEKTK